MPSSNSSASATPIRMTDGQMDWSEGVDSSRAPTIVSENNPNGLSRNSLAWLNNATVRAGGITQRTGYVPICQIRDSTGLYQGGWMYEQSNGLPYLVVAISGKFYRVRVDTDNSVEDITGPVVFPAAQPLYHFAQGEEFMVVQAGDYATAPAFWDNAAMRHSLLIAGGELPAAGPMIYYQGRLWYAYYREYTAGDIVKGAAGTAPYAKRDSILKVTENPVAFGGDGFAVPSHAGSIRGFGFPGNLDKNLGEGTLFVFTAKQVYAMDVPITRTDWIAATGSNQPNQRVVQRNNGGVSDRSVVAVNGDLFYQSLEPGVRSLMTALKYFGQWGNRPISANIDRALAFNDRSLMRYSSGVEFGNRLYMAILPEQAPQGVIHRGIAVLDFDPIQKFQTTASPAWEGIHEGLDVLQLFTGEFGGRERMFAVIVNRTTGSIDLWEMTDSQRADNVDHLVAWFTEFPAFTWGAEFDLKKLDGGELWIDKLFGDVVIKVYYRVDADPCWQLWHLWKGCSGRTSCEDVTNPVCYPLEETAGRESGRFPITLPSPPMASCNAADGRPRNIGHQFQVKLEIVGWCRIRGIVIHAVPYVKTPYQDLVTPAGPNPGPNLL